MTSLIEGLKSGIRAWQPLPGAPHGDGGEFYLHLQAPFFLGHSQVLFGWVDLYITWEEGELMLCFGVSLNEDLFASERFGGV